MNKGWIVTVSNESIALAADWGDGGTGNYTSIVFYDWDEKTILGSTIVNKSDPDAAARQIEEFTESLYPAGYDPGINTKTVDDVTYPYYDPDNGTYYNASSVLTNKKGYSFGKWVEMDAKDENGEKVYTIYGDEVSISSGSTVLDIPEPADVDYSDFGSEKILKAAFKSNPEMVETSDAAERDYTLSWDSFNRHGGGASYSIKIRVQREQNLIGVPRCRDAALRVVMADGATNIYSEILIDDVDDQVVEIAAPPTVDSVNATVIDIGGVSNWVNATITRSNIYTVDAGDTGTEAAADASKQGYVFLGNLAYINDILDSGDDSLVASHYSVAGLDVSKGHVHGTTSTGGVALRAQAFINLREAYASKNANGSHVDLTWQEMADAIASGTKPAAVVVSG